MLTNLFARVLSPVTSLLLGFALLGADSAQALPADAIVISGSVNWTQSSNQLAVTSSPSSIINFGDFSIANDELVTFSQNSGSSATLLRNTGSNPLAIFGDLTSNGGLFIESIAGIFLGPGAHIDASFLTLSTFHISDADFLTGNMDFDVTGNAEPILISGDVNIHSGGNLSIYGGTITVDNNANISVPSSTDSGASLSINTSGMAFIAGGTIQSGGVVLSSGDVTLNGGGDISVDGGTFSVDITITPAVPEPETYAMMLAGLGALGFMARRRKSS